MKSVKARALLAEIRELDRRIREAHGSARGKLVNKRAGLVLRYITALAQGVLLSLVR